MSALFPEHLGPLTKVTHNPIFADYSPPRADNRLENPLLRSASILIIGMPCDGCHIVFGQAHVELWFQESTLSNTGRRAWREPEAARWARLSPVALS